MSMKSGFGRIFAKPERNWILPLLSAVFVILIPAVTTGNVILNRMLGAYSSNADTIVIPVIHSVTIAIIYFIYLLILNIISITAAGRRKTVAAGRTKFSIIAGVLLTLPGILFSLLMVLYWFSLNHLPVIIVYFYGIYLHIRLMLMISGDTQVNSEQQ